MAENKLRTAAGVAKDPIMCERKAGQIRSWSSARVDTSLTGSFLEDITASLFTANITCTIVEVVQVCCRSFRFLNRSLANVSLMAYRALLEEALRS